MKVLFICKRRNTCYGISYGLLNSAEFVSGMLGSIGVDSKVVVVNDNNDIDREVTKMEGGHTSPNPPAPPFSKGGLEGISKEGPRSIVIIEALWVVPEKFDILKQLHPNVEWIVRIHSKSSFLASEGIAMDWINRYFDKGVRVAFNNIDTRELFASTFSRDFLYLPNAYPVSDEEYYHKITDSHVVNIGCFGALRLLKNHLQQAMSAIIFADRIGKKLLFHLNEDDTEDAENPVYKNLESLFDRGKHALVTHRWSPHDEFIEVVRQMDLGLQVSFSESYNIVAADFASNGVPIIVSRDIEWMPSWYQADPNVESIVDRLMFAWSNRHHKELTELSTGRIAEHNAVAISAWFIEIGTNREVSCS